MANPNPADDPLAFAYQVGRSEVKAAEAKAEADRLERMYRRIRATILIGMEGRSADEREARARTDPRAVEAEDAWLDANREREVSFARRDAMRVVWECYRTLEASRRAELQRGM